VNASKRCSHECEHGTQECVRHPMANEHIERSV
jgi:hypothetical protein